MADYATLKAAIQAVIYENGNQEITGSVMQATLLAMVNSLGANYQYAGIATPSTNPGTPDQNVFYLAGTAGTYVNFGNIVLAENEVAILKYNGSWTKEASGFASAEVVDELNLIVNGVNETLDDTDWENKSIQASLMLTPDNNWRLSPAIKVVKGTTFEINTAGNNLWCLVSCNESGAILSGLVQLKGTADTNKIYNYIIEADGYVRVSYKKSIAGAYAKVAKEGLKDLPEEVQIKTELGVGILWSDGSYVSYNDGSIQNSSFASATNMIDISMCAGKELFYSRLCSTSSAGFQGMALYDANSQYISGVAPILNAPAMGIQLDSIIIPSTAKYARFSCPTANKSSFELYFFGPLKSAVEELNSQVQDIKGTVQDIDNELSDSVKEPISISWISGQYYDGLKTIKSNVNYSRAVIELTNYDNLEKVEVNLYSTGAQVYLFLEDADHNTIWKFLIDSNTVYPLTIDIPETAAYLLLSNKSSLGVGTADAIIKGDASWIRPSLEGLLSKTPEYFLKGKKISFLGDSITYGNGATSTSKRYSTLFSNRCGAIENNLGVAATGIANNMLNGTSGQRFVTRATAANLQDSKLIIVFGGTNDFSYDSKAIGDLFAEETITPDEYIGSKQKVAVTDTDTFAGALHNLISTIRTNCPDIPIVFLTPLKRGRYSAGRPTSYESNQWGDYLGDFCTAIKEICAYYSIPVLDLNAKSELDFSNASIATAFSADSLHPNDAGHDIIAELLYRFVEQNIIVR